MADLTEKQASLSVKVAGANSSGDETNFANVDVNGSVYSTLKDSAGTSIASALDTAGANNLLVSATHNIYVSASNSSTTNLASGATFLGTAELNLNADAIQICIKADQPLTVSLEQSNDNTNWDFINTYTLDTNQAEGRLLTAVGSYARVRVTNDGASATTYFNLQFVLVPITAILPQSLTDSGNLKTSIEEIGNGVEDKLINADRAIYGQGITSSKLSLLNADFTLALNANDITTSVSGGGTVTQGSGIATLSTGTATTAAAALVSNRTLRYAIQREAHIAFNAHFTTPTSANSYQRYGLYDVNNGLFLGYEGLTFGITYRSGGSDIFTSIANFNKDKLNGSSGSKFTRDHVPEAVDFTKGNAFRIRFGRSSRVNFEIYSPDGNWIAFHIIKLPNSSTYPVLQSSTLPYRAEVSKTGADATDLKILTQSIDVSIVDSPVIYGPEDVKGRKYTTANLGGQTTSQTVYTVSTGRVLKVTTLDISVGNASLATTGLLNVRDGTTGTILYSVSIPPSTNQANAGGNKTLTFSVPLRFSSSVYAEEASGTLTYSIMFVGYEAES